MWVDDHAPRRIASSAYRKWDILGPLFGSPIPGKRPMSEARWTTFEKASIAMIKRNGERGSPWGIPRSQLNSIVGHPLIRTADLVEVRMPWIHLIHLVGKPICSLMESRKFQLTVSNAFSKSILKQYVSRLLFFQPIDYFVQHKGTINDVSIGKKS